MSGLRDELRIYKVLGYDQDSFHGGDGKWRCATGYSLDNRALRRAAPTTTTEPDA